MLNCVYFHEREDMAHLLDGKLVHRFTDVLDDDITLFLGNIRGSNLNLHKNTVIKMLSINTNQFSEAKKHFVPLAWKWRQVLRRPFYW